MTDLSLENLPSGYQPYQDLIVCSNAFRGVQIPIASGEQPILLVGRGVFPLIWLAARTAPTSSLWMYVVDASKVANAGVKVDFGDSITVRIGPTKVISVAAETPERAIITLLDLRPLGLNIVGDTAGLQLGSNSFSHNAIVGARVGIQVGPAGSAHEHAQRVRGA